VVAVIGHFLVGLGWAAAVVLGAILAPPDPVAATSVAGKTGLPHRLVVILEGKGLVNDAVATVAYGIALEALTTGKFETTHILRALLQEVPVGGAVRGRAGLHAAIFVGPGLVPSRASGRTHSLELFALCQYRTGFPAARTADRRDRGRLAG
jgi:NhaP-type Na+/H+ or K+/H+ antiporter